VNKKKTRKQLVLNRATVRRLADKQAQQAGGGVECSYLNSWIMGGSCHSCRLDPNCNGETIWGYC
jgi:hypothetical protein